MLPVSAYSFQKANITNKIKNNENNHKNEKAVTKKIKRL